MANQTGFQTNAVIFSAFWIYKPDPNIDPIGREQVIEVNGLQKIESTQDHNKVWLFYAANNTSTSQEPYILEGSAAHAFMSDMESLFL